MEHVYSSEEGSRLSTESSGTFGYDPRDFPPDESDDGNPQHHDTCLMAEDIWLDDTGASSHTTMSLKGMQGLRDMERHVTV